MPRPRRGARAAILALTAVLVALPMAAPARAGTYVVSGTCGQWTPWGDTNGSVAIYPACPELVARNVWGARSTPGGVGGGWRFDPPPGTAVVAVALQGRLQGLSGWQAAAYTEGVSARELVNCPGVTCPGAVAAFTTYPTFNSGPVILRVRCGAASCSNNVDGGRINLTAASVTLADGSAPSVAPGGRHADRRRLEERPADARRRRRRQHRHPRGPRPDRRRAS